MTYSLIEGGALDVAPRRDSLITRLARRVLVAIAITGAAGLLTAAIGFSFLETRLPDVSSFQSYLQTAREHSRVRAAGGEIVARFGPEVRTVVPIEQIPNTLLYAIVCAEDAAFFHHPGLDLLGIARALWVDLWAGRYVQGASTITQQFAKTRYLSREKTLTRKFKELVLARKLEQQLSKQDILAMYTNEIYFGNGRYGVEEAARWYFGKPVGQINVAEAALLAALINGPSRLNPFRHARAARQRRAYVLRQMLRHGYIDEATRSRAAAEPLPKKGHPTVQYAVPYYAAEVRRRALKRFGKDTLLHGGLRIDIGLDVTVQQAAETAVAEGLQRVDRKYRVTRPLRHYRTRAALKAGLARLVRRQSRHITKAGRVLLAVVRGYDTDRKSWLLDLGGATGHLPQSHLRRYKSENKAGRARSPSYKKGDLVRVSILRRDREGNLLVAEMGPQAALVAIEPRSRLVRALVGGDDHRLHPFNRALHARRQPGSTFKTFVFGAAIEAGMGSPDTRTSNIERTHISHGKPWTPRNYSGKYDGQLYSWRAALARSINSIAVEVAERVTPAKVADFARRAGVRSRLIEDLPLALGASSVNPLEMANAYATIAADGQHAEPVFIRRVIDRRGKQIYSADNERTRVIEAGIARALTDMLGEVIREGSGRSARVGRPVAGKTGTSNRGRDAWFVGFSPQLCAAVWVGHDDRKPMAKASGGRLALPIWAQFMRQAHDRVAVLPLPRLPHIVSAVQPPTPEIQRDPEAGAGEMNDLLLEPPRPAGQHSNETPALGDEIIDESALDDL